MLKKLVKYGNSSALVIDKAILELLNIAEASVLKISTDGKSIILTPQVNSVSQQINESYNSETAWLDVMAQETSKRYKISEDAKKEMINLYQRYKELHLQLSRNARYVEELSALGLQFNYTNSAEFTDAYRLLRDKFSPELVQVEKALLSFEKTHELRPQTGFKSQSLDENQLKNMQQEFTTVFKKHSEAFALYNACLNNSDYQHEIQLVAEKYNNNKNSDEYIKATEEIQRKYSPETQQLREELKAISQKYAAL